MSQTVWRHVRVVVLYAVLAFILTLPVGLNLTTHVAGQGGDPWQTLWRFENRQQQLEAALGQDQLGSFAVDQFLGGGEPRLVNNSVWPWMPLHLLFGQPFTYNLVWLLSFILSGYFMYLLVDYLLIKKSTENREHNNYGPVLAGLFYMLLPYHVAHSYGHFGAMQTQWLPLAILLTFLFVAKPTFWRAIGLAAVLAVQSWTEHHYLLWYGLFVAVWILAEWGVSKSFPLRVRSTQSKFPSYLILATLVALLAILPWWPTVRLAFGESDQLSLGVEQTVRFSADLFAFVTPASFHPVWGFLVNLFAPEGFTGNTAEATHYLGIIPLLFVVFFARSIPTAQRNLWVIVAVVFAVISLGPRLHLAGFVTPVPLPWTVLDNLPVFSSIRAVGRASVMVGIGFAVLFGFVAAAQLHRRWTALLLGFVLVLEFLALPIPIQSAQLPAVYADVATAPGKRIVEIPARTNYTASSKALYASAHHGKEVVGLIALERARASATDSEAQSLPGLRQLLHLRTTDLRELRPDFFDQDLTESFLESLAWLDVQLLLIHIDSLSQLQESTVRRFIESGTDVIPTQTDDAILYHIPTEALVGGDGVLLSRDGRWSVTRAEDGTIFAGINTEASVTLRNVTAEVRELILSWQMPVAEIEVVDEAGNTLPLDETGDSHHALTLQLPPGVNEFTFRAIGSNPVVMTNPILTVTD